MQLCIDDFSAAEAKIKKSREALSSAPPPQGSVQSRRQINKLKKSLHNKRMAKENWKDVNH